MQRHIICGKGYRMISTKEDLKNVIELEEKGYGRNSLIRRYLRELRICEYYNNCGGA